MKINQYLSVGITTWNRWSDLANTLSILQKSQLAECQIIVVDDCSEQLFPEGFWEQFNNLNRLEYHRLEENVGLVQARNRLAGLVKSKYLLSLDDDSYPIKGDFNLIIDFLESEAAQGVAAISIPYLDGPEQVKCCHYLNEPTVCNDFAGGSHIMVMHHFNELGGYAKWIDRQCEEGEYSMRAFQKGLVVVNYPAVLIRHDCVSTQRNWNKILFYSSRNALVMQWLYAPMWTFVLKWTLDVFRGFVLFIKGKGWGFERGVWAVLPMIAKMKVERSPMTLKQFMKYRSLRGGLVFTKF